MYSIGAPIATTTTIKPTMKDRVSGSFIIRRPWSRPNSITAAATKILIAVKVFVYFFMFLKVFDDEIYSYTNYYRDCSNQPNSHVIVALRHVINRVFFRFV